MNHNHIRITVTRGYDGEGGEINTVIWRTPDDSCINTESFPTLYEALNKARESDEPFALSDGYYWYVNGSNRVERAS